MSTTTTVASVTLRKVFRRARDRDLEYIQADAKLYQVGDQKPYFSLAGEEKDGHGESFGQIHDRLLKQWPKLAPLAAIHLSDADGEPMHAIANGWYWAGGYREWCKGASSDPPNAKHLANHLRIPLEQAQTIVGRVEAGELNKEEFRAFVETQRPRWKAEAQAALELIRSLAVENSQEEAA